MDRSGFFGGDANPFDRVELAFSPQSLDGAAALAGVELALSSAASSHPEGTSSPCLPRPRHPFQAAALAALGLTGGGGGGGGGGGEGEGLSGAWTTTARLGGPDNHGVGPVLVAAARALACTDEAHLPPPARALLAEATGATGATAGKAPTVQPAAQNQAATAQAMAQAMAHALGALGPQAGLSVASEERAALSACAALAAHALASFPTTRAQDEAEEAQEQRGGGGGGGGSSGAAASARRYRLAKKRTLEACVGALTDSRARA